MAVISMPPRQCTARGAHDTGASTAALMPAPASDAVRQECAERASTELARLYARRKALVLELHELNERIADLATIEMATFARPMRQRREAADLTTGTEDMPQ